MTRWPRPCSRFSTSAEDFWSPIRMNVEIGFTQFDWTAKYRKNPGGSRIFSVHNYWNVLLGALKALETVPIYAITVLEWRSRECNLYLACICPVMQCEYQPLGTGAGPSKIQYVKPIQFATVGLVLDTS